MASKNIIEIVIKATDQASQVAKQVEKATNQLGTNGSRSVGLVTQASQRLTNSWNSMRNTASSVMSTVQSKFNSLYSSLSNIGTRVKGVAQSFTQLIPGFSTVAESIKTKWSTTVEYIKSRTKSISTASSSITAPFRSTFSSIENSASQVFTSISTRASSVGSSIRSAFSSIGSVVSSAGSSIRTGIGTAFDQIKAKASSTFTSIQTHVGNLKSRIAGLASGFSGLGGVISMAFGAIGVSSVYQFTIGAALAREKLMSVTASVYGSKQAANELKTAVTSATKGTVVGFSDVMSAMNRVGVQFHLTSQQASQLAPSMTSVGVVAKALGYSGEQSIGMMQKAMRGLNGDTVTLWRGFSITKQQLMAAGWSGASDDVAGYNRALEKVIGSSKEYQAYTKSTEGQMALLQKNVSAVGRSLGEQLLPFINQVVSAFAKFTTEHQKASEALLLIGIAIMGLSAVSMVVLPIIELGSALKGLEIASTVSKALKDFALAEKLAAAATKIQAAAQWLLNAAMDANPIMIVVIAIIALVAILTYLYFNNEQVRNTLNALGSYLSGTFIGLWDYLCGAVGNTVDFFQNLYSAIINLPSTLSSLGASIWSWISGLPGQLASALTGIGSAIAGWIASLWTNISTWLNNGLATLGTWFSTLLTTLLDWGAQILGQIIAWFIMLPTVIPMYLNMIIMQVGTWIMGLINNLVLWGQTILTSIVTWLSMLPLTILTYLNFVIAYVYSWITNLWTAAVYAGSQFVNGVVQFIRLLPGRVYMFLYMTVMRVVAWALTMYQRARQTATNFVRAFIAIIQSLPGRFWSWLMNTLNRINPFSSQGRQRMATVARAMNQAFHDIIRNLPHIMWQELMHIGDNIRNSVGQLGKAMRDLAHNMLNKFKDALGIHSPGYMFKAIKGEMQYINDQLADSKSKLGKSAEKLGQGVLDGFNKTDFTDMTTPLEEATQTAQTTMQTGGAPVSANSMLGGRYTPTSDIQQDQNTTTPQIGSLVNTDQLTADTSLITTETQQITATIGTNSQLINTSLQGTQLTWGNLVTASNIGTQNLMANNTKTTTGYRNMTTQVGTQLNNLKSKNTSAWQNVKTTTQNNLNNILHSTKNVTTQMISAWNTMKNSIISAAQSIKSQSENRFNSLWSTISRFYHRIRNPGGAGSPQEGRVRAHRGNSNGGSAIRAASTGISSIFKPRKRKVQSIDLTGMFSQPEIQYMTPTGTGSKMIATSDIMKYLNSRGGAGWNDIVSPNNRYIRNESNKWKANGPKVYGKYPTGNNLFKVKEFENGTPQVSYETFKKMAESVFSHCHYEFYWDSERYGSWQAAAQNGGMNCSDSSDFLIALAHACGLSASKVHGHWNQFGHFWANVAGHKMDTTGWMLHRTWTPSQSHAGPAPHVDLGNNTSNSNSDTVTHDGRIELDVNINLSGADKVDEATVNTVIRETLTDKNILKQIARDPNFQEYDNKMKIKMNKQITRMG